MPSNLEIQEQLVKLQQNVSVELGKQTKEYRSQVDLMEELVASLRDFPAFKDSAKNLEGLATALKGSSANSKDAEASMEKIAASIKKGSEGARDANSNFTDYFDTLKKRYTDVNVLAIGFERFSEGIKLGVNSVKMLGSGIKMAAGIMRQLAVSVITFPFKILSGLMNMAGSGGGSNELAQALEDVRKEFGYLNKTAGGAIVDMARSMKGPLAETGLSVYRVFGNLAERIKYFAEVAKNLGPVFDGVASSIAKGAEAYGAYNKGLGLTAEGQRAVGTRAMALGQDVNEVNREIANYSIQLASAFGLTQKQVSRDVGVLMADFSHFGHLAPKELAQISVYARKLGIDVKVLGNVMDKSFNFEDAATQAAQLSQAFGLNIDAMKLMQEQDPAKKMDMLRKSFFAAGKSVETMTAQERRLLAQQTGLDEASLALAFSAKNQSMSYDQVSKKGDMAKKKQLSQTEVLEKLAGAIERITQSGSAMQGGFFDLFFKGFQRGIILSSEFRGIMRNLRADMRDTFRAGISVGREFVKSFPGVKDVFNGIADLFKPQRFRAMLGGVTGAFKSFFKMMTTDPATALPVLMERLKTTFFDWFNGGEAGGSKIINGVKKFSKAILTIGLSVIKVALKSLIVEAPKLIHKLFDFLKTVDIGKIVGDLKDTFNKISESVFGRETLSKVAGQVVSLLGSAFNWATSREGIEALKGFASSLISKPRIIIQAIEALFDSVGTAVGDIDFEEIFGKIGTAVESVLGSMLDEAGDLGTRTINLLFDSMETALSSAESMDISGVFNRMFDGVGRIASRAMDNILPILMRAVDRLPGLVERAAPLILSAFNSIWGFISNLPNKLNESIQNAFRGGSGGEASIAGRLAESFGKILWIVIKTGATIQFRLLTQFLPKFFLGVTAVILTLFTELWKKIKETAIGTWNNLVEFINGGLGRITSYLTSWSPTVGAIVSGLFDGIKLAVKSYMDYLKTIFSIVGQFLISPVELFKNAWVSVSRFISRIVSGISTTIIPVFVGMWNSIKNSFVATWDSIVGYFNEKLSSASSVLTSWTSSISAGIGTLFTGIQTSIDVLISFARGAFSTMGQFLTDPVGTFSRSWESAVEFVSRAIGSIVGFVTNDLVGGITSRISGLTSTLTAPFTTLMNLVRRNHEHSVNTIVGRDMDRTVQAVDRAGSRIENTMSGITENVTSGLTNQSGAIRQAGPAAMNAAAADINLPTVNGPNPQELLTKLQNLSSGLPRILEILANPMFMTGLDSFNALVGGTSFRLFLRNLHGLGEGFSGLSEINIESSIIDRLISSINNVKVLIPTLTGLMQDGAFEENILQFNRTFRQATIGTLSGNIREMVSQVNSISSELARLTIPNIDVTLRRVSEGLGTQLTRQYQISSRVNVAVNLNVTIDAEDLENSLVTRPRTRIVSRPAQ